jgi:hypothetical protein
LIYYVFQFSQKLYHPITVSRLQIDKIFQQLARVIGKSEKPRMVGIDGLCRHCPDPRADEEISGKRYLQSIKTRVSVNVRIFETK